MLENGNLCSQNGVRKRASEREGGKHSASPLRSAAVSAGPAAAESRCGWSADTAALRSGFAECLPRASVPASPYLSGNQGNQGLRGRSPSQSRCFCPHGVLRNTMPLKGMVTATPRSRSPFGMVSFGTGRPFASLGRSVSKSWYFTKVFLPAPGTERVTDGLKIDARHMGGSLTGLGRVPQLVSPAWRQSHPFGAE